MKCSGCSCDCNGEWHTLQSQKKKLKKRLSQILLKVKCGFRFAIGSQTQEDITMESGNFPFGISILQQIHLSVMQLQANIDTNTKETGKIQIHVWSLHLPHFWSPDRGTTITHAALIDDLEPVLCVPPLFSLSLLFSFNPSLAERYDSCCENSVCHQIS